MSEDDSNAGFGLIVAFPDDSASFVHGFEAGQIWFQLRGNLSAEMVFTTHVENREVLSRMAIAEGWSISVEPTGTEGWDVTRLTKTQAPLERPNPHGLKLVS